MPSCAVSTAGVVEKSTLSMGTPLFVPDTRRSCKNCGYLTSNQNFSFRYVIHLDVSISARVCAGAPKAMKKENSALTQFNYHDVYLRKCPTSPLIRSARFHAIGVERCSAVAGTEPSGRSITYRHDPSDCLRATFDEFPPNRTA